MEKDLASRSMAKTDTCEVGACIDRKWTWVGAQDVLARGLGRQQVVSASIS